MADPLPLSERRARLAPWVKFADQAQIVGGVREDTRRCSACERVISVAETDYLVVLRKVVALRLDQECLELWREMMREK
jgi:hypothetical protein